MESPLPVVPAPSPNDSNHLFKHVVDSLPDGVYITDRERRIMYWNHAAEDLTGYNAEEVLGKCCADNILTHMDESGNVLCLSDCPLSRTMADGLPHRADLYLHHKSGHRVPVEVRVRPVWDGNGGVVGAVEIFSDNSRQRAMRERAKELAKFAFLDPTSQVGNRSYLQHQLSQHFEQYSKFGTAFGIILADLDEYKCVNDTYGHAAGDAVLVAVAKTLSNCLRASDVVGRWGGDEFLAIISGVTKQILAQAAEKFRRLVARSAVLVDGAQVQLTISLGAGMALPGDSPESLLKRVDELLYTSKNSGRNRVSS